MHHLVNSTTTLIQKSSVTTAANIHDAPPPQSWPCTEEIDYFSKPLAADQNLYNDHKQLSCSIIQSIYIDIAIAIAIVITIS